MSISHPRRIATAASIALSLGAFAAHAEPVVDKESGLTIAPPAGYRAQQIQARGQNAVAFAVKRPDDKDTGCQVAYGLAPANAKFAQGDINAMMKTKQHQDLAKSAISTIYETSLVAPFDHGGVTGVELISDIKPREGIPPRAQEIRNMMLILETPKGRASIVCVADKTDFDARRAEFHALARGVTLPK